MNTLIKYTIRLLARLFRPTVNWTHAFGPIAMAGLLLASVNIAHASDYVIVVDTSGSMTERVSAKDKRVRIQVVQKALREYLPALPQSSRVHLIAFNSGIVAEKEIILGSPEALAEALAWVDDLKRYAETKGGTHLWTTLRKALVVATDYSGQNPGQPVIVRVLTDGADNERVASLEQVLKECPLVDGEHIRGNLVLLGDFELKTKLGLPDGAFESTRSVHWVDLFPPVILSIPAGPKVGDEVRFVENTKSIYSNYEWLVDGQSAGTDKVLSWRFSEARPHRVTLKVKGLDGDMQSSVLVVSVAVKPDFSVELVDPKISLQPGKSVRLLARSSEKAARFSWLINGKNAGSAQELDWQPNHEGNYEVKVTAWDLENREASATRNFPIAEAPLVARIKAPQQATSGQGVQFASETAGPVARVEWDFGDGSKSQEKDPLHVYVLTGRTSAEFNVSFKVVSPAGHTAESATHSISVQALTSIQPPVADFTVLEARARVGKKLHLVDSSRGQIESWQWEITGEPLVHERNPVFQPTSGGEKIITLTVRGPGGIHTAIRKVFVRQRYTPVGIAINTNVDSGSTPFKVHFLNSSTGDVQSWHWDFGDGNSSLERSPEHEYAAPGEYVASVTAIPDDPDAAQLKHKIALTIVKPWPLWARILVPLGVIVALGAIVAALLRRHRLSQLRLPVYYWAHDSNVCQRIDFTRADEARDLPGLQMRVRRSGKSPTLIADTQKDALFVHPDGQETNTQNLDSGGRVTVRFSTGGVKVVAITTRQKPRKPEPPPQEITAPHDPVEVPAVASDSDINWGWETSPAK